MAGAGDSAAATPSTTVGALVRCLDGDALRLVTLGPVEEATVGELVIHDRHDPRPARAGDLVLAVGLDADEAVRLLRDAGEALPAAIVLKGARDADAAVLRDTCERLSVALFDATRELTWSRLHTLLHAALAALATRWADGDESPLGDLFALADALAAAAGGPATIEDTASNVLAYSRGGQTVDEGRRLTILTRRVPASTTETLHRRGVFRQLSAGAVVQMPRIDDAVGARLAIAVRAGGETLGFIWVAESDEPLASDAERILEEAAGVAALHLIRHYATVGLGRRERSERLRRVLDDEPGADDAIAIDARAAVVVGFKLRLDDAPLVRAHRGERIAATIALYFDAFGATAGCVAVGEVVYATLIEPPTGRERVERLIRETSRGVERAGGEVERVAVSAAGTGPGGLREGRWAVDRALAFERSAWGQRTILHVAETPGRLVLARVAEHRRHDRRLRLPALELLRAQDAEHGSDYLRTLGAYLDAFGDVRAAADSLHVHRNTFRYRLRRLCELAALDLDDPAERLALHLLLRVEDGHGAPAPSV